MDLSTETFNVLSLCSGAGGLDLGFKLAIPGSRTVAYVEREAACIETMVTRMQEGLLDEAPIHSDVKTFDGRPWRGVVDCIIGGYPCQPFSIAGQQKGEEDPRHLWPDFSRIIREIEPRCCSFENVSNHLNIGFYSVARDLQSMGYEVEAGLFSAEEVRAPHKRERLFILAHRDFEHDNWRGVSGSGRRIEDSIRSGELADSEIAGSQERRGSGRGHAEISGFERCGDIELGPFPPGPGDLESWRDILDREPLLAPAISTEEAEAECKLRGLANGLAYRVERLRSGGNGVVPLVAAYAVIVLAATLNERISRQAEERAA